MRVDDVTQWEVVSATAQISEAALKPVLEALLRQFPFRILVFHSDNGSEFINHIVAELLNKDRADQEPATALQCELSASMRSSEPALENLAHPEPR
jgi:hypothetical protein